MRVRFPPPPPLFNCQWSAKLAAFMKNLTLVSLFIFAFCFAGFCQNLPKLSSDEIISKHLASIGKPEAIAAVKSRIMVGVGEFTSRTQAGKVGGPAQFASDGQKLLLALIFNANNYPFEKLGYDGKELTTSMLPNGGYSPLSNFLKSNKFVLKHGLFGGVLSEGWPLLRSEKDLKIESGGISKIGDRNVYKLKISGAGTGDAVISLYFDAENFHHVRSEYFYRVSQITSPNPNSPTIGGTAPTDYTLTEDFSNFSKVDDLVLPLTYVVECTSSGGRPVTWTVNFTQAYNNQPLEANVFKVS
jgi:hypothetical protein